MDEHQSSLGVCIPCHIRSDQDLALLYRALESIRDQTQQPSTIVLSDDSPVEIAANEIRARFPDLKIQVVRNFPNQGIARNSNFGVSHLNTDWVQVLHQDDWLSTPTSYQKIIRNISDLELTHKWFLVSGIHEDGTKIIPVWKNSILFGFNSIGGPSCLFIRRENYIEYDSRFQMLVDIKNYLDYFESFGDPGIIKVSSVNYGNPPTRVSRNVSIEHTLDELEKLMNIASVSLLDIIECLRDSTLNSYQRRLLLYLAKKNNKIPNRYYLVFCTRLFFARLNSKIK